MKVNESNYDIFERVRKITLTNYEIIWKDAENIDGYIDPEGMLAMIEDLVCEVDRLKEEAEDRERDIEDNYVHRPMSDYTGDVYDDRF